MGEKMHDAPDVKQTKDANDLFKGITQDSIKTVDEIKEVSATAPIKPDLKEDAPKPLNEAPKQEKKVELSREVNIDETLKDEVDKKVKITFKGKDFMKKEINKKTADAPLQVEDEEIKPNAPKMLGSIEPTAEEMREQIIKAENTTKESFSVEDYQMMAEFIIDALDWGGSSGLMYLAKDTTDAPYTLSVSKKDRLKKQLTRILIKSNAKMNFGVLFALSLILAYMKPVKHALETRKSIKEAELKLQREKQQKIKDEQERKRKEALKEKNRIVPKEKPIKQKKETVEIKEEVINDIKGGDKDKEPVVIKDEKPKEDKGKGKSTKGEDKPTEDTRVDKKTGKVVLDRKKGNPNTQSRTRSRTRNNRRAND
jgi:hypothetical protein